MPRIFISYRRDDSAGYAGRLSDRLIGHFGPGQVFIDVVGIEPGLDFAKVIEEAVGSCDALLALIGKQWLTIADSEGKRRLDKPDDWVRLEIAAALERDIRVIPVLVRGASMPRRDDLPDPLKALARRQAVRLDDDEFHHDVDRLIEALEKALGRVEPDALQPVRVEPVEMPRLEWCDVPAAQVTIEGRTYDVQAFRIGKYPVTYAQFRAFLDASDGFVNDGWWQGLTKRTGAPGQQKWPIDNHPRENVSWYDAIAFCRWLSYRTGLAISLPTEQQWQRAAQGDESRVYPWGDAFEPDRCNTREGGIYQTTPVDQYSTGAGPYGAYDLAGNVWEWCLNEFDNPDNIGLSGTAERTVRGGSWLDPQARAHSTFRQGYPPATHDYRVGFRAICRAK